MSSSRVRMRLMKKRKSVGRARSTSGTGLSRGSHQEDLLSQMDFLQARLDEIFRFIISSIRKDKVKINDATWDIIAVKYVRISTIAKKLILATGDLDKQRGTTIEALSVTSRQLASMIRKPEIFRHLIGDLNKPTSRETDDRSVSLGNDVCCSRAEPHIHEIINDSPIVIQLKKGTTSEVQLVGNLMSHVETLPEEEKKKLLCLKLNQNAVNLGENKESRETTRTTTADQDVVWASGDSRQSNSSVKVNVAGGSQRQSSLDRRHALSQRDRDDRKSASSQRDPLPMTDGAVDPLLIFDKSGNPLTDSNGHPLINMNGRIVVKFKEDKPVCHINGERIYDKNGLPFVSNLDEPLTTPTGEPLRIYTEDRVPLTDDLGKVSKLSNGCYSIVLDRYNRILSDALGSPVYDAKGKPFNAEFFMAKKQGPEGGSKSKDGALRKYPSLYNEKGFLLTDPSGKPLLGPRGEPLLKVSAEGEITDVNGALVYDRSGKVYGPRRGKPRLALFDLEHYPLTNSLGDVLKDPHGKSLLHFDPTGRPVSDRFGRQVYDARGTSCNDANFKPYTTSMVYPRDRALFPFAINIFDSRGRPLLDHDGTPLTDLEGKPLIKTLGNEIVHDLNGDPVFDEVGIPLTQFNGRWITPSGAAYRVFNSQGRPLTDRTGGNLFSIRGEPVLKIDKAGRPIYDELKAHVCDTAGRPVTDPEFDPTAPPLNDDLKMQVFVGQTPLKVFDRSSHPLTDSEGMALLNSQGHCLIQFNEAGIPVADITGQPVYDENHLPLNCSPTTPILSMTRIPYRLFDTHKRALTDRNGFPLSLANGRCLIKFDSVGRPASDLTGGPLLDVYGRSVVSDSEARPEAAPKDPQLVLSSPYFDSTGRPLTDKSGNLLVNAEGYHMRVDFQGNPASDPYGGPLFDQYGRRVDKSDKTPEKKDRETLTKAPKKNDTDPFGRPLKDSTGVALFDEYGRPLYDLYRRPLYDSQGRPVADSIGRRLSDGKPEPTFKLHFDPSLLDKPLKSGKLGRGLSGLKDLFGGPLWDAHGQPLYNSWGKPTVDLYGRELYETSHAEETGEFEPPHGALPLCDSLGRPLSTTAAREGDGVNVRFVKDVVNMIRLPKYFPECKISGALAVGRRVPSSPLLKEEWILNTGETFKAVDEPQMYWALVRITVFDNDKKIYELLKAHKLASGGGDNEEGWVSGMMVGGCTGSPSEEGSSAEGSEAASGSVFSPRAGRNLKCRDKPNKFIR